MRQKISVIVSTYNRADLLIQSLTSLTNQSLRPDGFEVVVVDNNSTDHTAAIVKTFIKSHSRWQIKYVFERTLGMSVARNTGARVTKGQFLAFFDDDAKASQNWLQIIDRNIKLQAPDVLGGPITPFYLTSKPMWFKDDYELRGFGAKKRLLTKNEYLSGSNIVVRRDLFFEHDGFSPDLGPQGRSRGFGDETWLQMQLWQTYPQLKVLYLPQAKVEHLVPNYKMRVQYAFLARYKLGQYNYKLAYPRLTLIIKTKTLIKAVRAVLLILLTLLKMPGRDRRLYPFYQNYLWEVVAPNTYWFGALRSVI